MALGGVFLALAAGALAWWAGAAVGMEPSSWRHGLVTGMAVGAVAAAVVGAAVRPALKKAARRL
jgi:outer membrane lipoprotein SlyB